MGHVVRAIGPTLLYRALQEVGFELPKDCGDVELLLPVDGVPQLRMTVFIHGERLELLGQALARLGEATKPNGKPFVDAHPHAIEHIWHEDE